MKKTPRGRATAAAAAAADPPKARPYVQASVDAHTYKGRRRGALGVIPAQTPKPRCPAGVGDPRRSLIVSSQSRENARTDKRTGGHTHERKEITRCRARTRKVSSPGRSKDARNTRSDGCFYRRLFLSASHPRTCLPRRIAPDNSSATGEQFNRSSASSARTHHPPACASFRLRHPRRRESSPVLVLPFSSRVTRDTIVYFSARRLCFLVCFSLRLGSSSRPT